MTQSLFISFAVYLLAAAAGGSTIAALSVHAAADMGADSHDRATGDMAIGIDEDLVSAMANQQALVRASNRCHAVQAHSQVVPVQAAEVSIDAGGEFSSQVTLDYRCEVSTAGP